MSSEWPWVRLGENCVKIGSGATPKGGKETYLKHGQFVLIRSQNVYNDGFEKNGLAFISEDQARQLNGASVQADDVLLNITGDSVARACLAPAIYPHARVNQHVAIIRPNPATLDSRFVRYFLVSPRQQDLMHGLAAAGATRNALTKGMIEAFNVPCPPLGLQNGIADMLCALDERIALLREINATLEAIAQSLFKSWFVDFDPVQAKAKGREPEGLDAETAGLFPEGFEESRMGLVPTGWKISTLGEHVQAERGLSYKGAGLCSAEEGLPMHNLNSVYEGGGYKYPGIKFYKGDFKGRHITRAGDIIVANTEQGHHHRLIGFPAIVPAAYDNGIFSHHLYRLTIKSESPLTRHVLYYLLMSPNVREQIIGCANGSTVNMLKMQGMEIPRFVCPPAAVARAFDDLTLPLRAQIELNVARAQTLAVVRDTLLPQLISGRIRLTEAKTLVREAA